MQRLLLIDNNDSFTFNIVDYLRRMPALLFDVINSQELDIDSIENYDKVIISPGPGLPADFPVLYDLFHLYIGKIPILGICLGHQALVEYLGGNLIQLAPVVHGQSHALKVVKTAPIFRDIPSAFRVGLYHSWALDPKTLPAELEILALSEDDIIMAVKHRTYPIYGVQFHPESYITEHGYSLLENFIEP